LSDDALFLIHVKLFRNRYEVRLRSRWEPVDSGPMDGLRKEERRL